MVWGALLLTVLLAGGCSDFDEMKSQKLYSQAEAVLQSGDETAAEVVLAELVAKYPRTQAGEAPTLCHSRPFMPVADCLHAQERGFQSAGCR